MLYYPVSDNYAFEQSFSLPAEILTHLFNKVKFSMASNDVRHYLNGMLLNFSKDVVSAVSTDGHRLSVSEWLAGETDNVQVNLSDTHIQFIFKDTEITSTLINADYPAYETVIPELSDTLIFLPKEELRKALQRAKILSSEYGVGVSLTFSPWKLNLSAKNMDNESVEDSIDINYDGETIKTAFNINYLMDVINVIESDNLTLSLQDSQSSCLIYDSENENSRYIVMPMNI